MNKFLRAILSFGCVFGIAVAGGTAAAIEGSASFGDSGELERWTKAVEGGRATVAMENSELYAEDGASLKVSLDKEGEAFAGVSTAVADKIAEASENFAGVIGMSFKLYNPVALTDSDEFVVRAGLGEKGEWKVGANQTIGDPVPSLTQTGEFSVAVDFSCVPEGAAVADIQSMTFGIDGAADAEFYLYDLELICTSSAEAEETRTPVRLPIDDIRLRAASFSGEDITVKAEPSTDAAKSKQEDGKSIAVGVESAEAAENLNYAVYFPFNEMRNKTELVNPKGFSLWVYNETAAESGGIYFKFTDGDENLGIVVYDESGSVVTDNPFGLNFVGFRRYVMNLSCAQLAKSEIEMGVWGASSELAFHFSDFAFLDNTTPVIGDKSVALGSLTITTLAWSDDPAFTSDIGNMQSEEYSHSEDMNCVKIARSASAAWSVAQIYVQDFDSHLMDGSGAKRPRSFSFWLYNAKALEGNNANGITIKYVDDADGEHETWNYFWEDEQGNLGTGNALDFVGWRKYTVSVNATEREYPRLIVGVWGTAEAEAYLSDFSVFDDAAAATVDVRETIELVKPSSENFEKAEASYDAEIASIEGGVRLTVAPDGASGSVSVERTLEDVFTAEDTSLKISFEAEENYGDALGVDLIYDDGSGAGAAYRAFTISFAEETEVSETIDFSELPYYVTSDNVTGIRISATGTSAMSVAITGIEAERDAAAEKTELYSRPIADFETSDQVNKWTVVKDLDTTVVKTTERTTVKVGSGAMRFRFENLKGAFSWGQLNFSVEDIVSSNTDKEICGFSFWLHNETYVPAGELGFMIKLIQTDGLEFEVPWNFIATEKGIYNGLCYDGWMKVEIPLGAATASECDYNDGYDPENKREFDWKKLRSVGIGVWGSYYDYEKGYSCNLVIDDLRLLSRKQLGNVRYDISYQLNGGQLPEGAVNVYEQGQTVTLPVPERQGYTFAGWYTDELLSGTPVTQIDASQSGDIVLYAAWSENGGCGSSLSAGGICILSLLAMSGGFALRRKNNKA